ncbi:MAG: Nif3-like dinuclear metal center hexameric protein [FCB group bacterium]
MGIIAQTKKPMTENELLKIVQSTCSSPIRFSHGNKMSGIEKIAIVGGSGSSFIDFALENDADAFITADITYHTFHKANGKLMLIDPGHHEMEKFVPEGLVKLLKENLSQKDYTKIVQSDIITNPVFYYPDTEKYSVLQRQNLINNKKYMVN